MTIPNLNPLGYTGLKEQNPPNVKFYRKDPTNLDIIGFDIGDIWINISSQISWQLLSKANNIAIWSQMAGGTAQVSTLTGDDAIAVPPVAGNINITGANGISTSNSAPSTIQVLNTSTITSDDAAAIPFIGGNLFAAGNNGITTSNPAVNILRIENTETVTPDAGGAISFAAGNLGLVGNAAQGVSTSGAANTITVTVQDATTAVKGVSSFSSTDFSVAAGAVSSKCGWILLSSQQAINVATIDFINLPAYKNYVLTCSNVTPSTDGEALFLEVSQDNGATWIAAGYESGINYSAYNSAVLTNDNSAIAFVISGSINNANDYESVVYILNSHMPDQMAISGTGSWSDKVLGATSFGTIGGRCTTGINAFRLSMSAHNIDTGNFSLYGIRE